MKPKHFLLQAMIAFVWTCISCSWSSAAISQVNSPSDIGGATTINFDGYPHDTVANTLYQPQGITFTRDDGQAIFLYDWAGLGRTTTSSDNVLATTSGPDASIYVSHLNVFSSSPIFAMGAYFGNDQASPDFNTIRMSAYGLTGDLLGFVQVAANNNTNVDQFVGLRSDVPVAHVRFDNLSAAGAPSTRYSVVIDDLMFVSVPEPSALAISLVGLLVAAFALRKKLNRNKA